LVGTNLRSLFAAENLRVEGGTGDDAVTNADTLSVLEEASFALGQRLPWRISGYLALYLSRMEEMVSTRQEFPLEVV
jgi:hypothetical protein